MFVVHLHMSPTEYWALTLQERDAITQEYIRANKRRGR